ncbi:MAG: hypothetical protein Q7J69_03875 [Candidatus Omnitrophota bacterium]|nr:hypothetical protein [Candidatus Omnitrophota bacterium]
MKPLFRKLLGLGVVAAFLVMATAMVLPHSHDAETAHHVCWICQSKATGVSTPEVSPRPAVLHLISIAAPAARRIFETQASFLFSEARAPPVSSPVLS